MLGYTRTLVWTSSAARSLGCFNFWQAFANSRLVSWASGNEGLDKLLSESMRVSSTKTGVSGSRSHAIATLLDLLDILCCFRSEFPPHRKLNRHFLLWRFVRCYRHGIAGFDANSLMSPNMFCGRNREPSPQTTEETYHELAWKLFYLSVVDLRMSYFSQNPNMV